MGVRSGGALLLLWLLVAALWAVPLRYVAGDDAVLFPLWPALLYLAVTVALTVAAAARTLFWLRRR